jgi:hypothetical protein
MSTNHDNSVFTPHFDEAKIAAGLKGITKAADVADGNNDGIIHKDAVIRLLEGEIKHPTALSRDLKFKPEILEAAVRMLKSDKSGRDEMLRPTNAQIDERVYAMAHGVASLAAPKTPSPNNRAVHSEQMASLSVPSERFAGPSVREKQECKETIMGYAVPSWVPDVLTTKTCKGK